MSDLQTPTSTQTSTDARQSDISLKLILTGTAGPELQPDRAGPSQVVCVGGSDPDLLLFDCGDRTVTQLLRAGIDPGAINELFFTHLHPDHIHGTGPFVIGGWQRGRRELLVYSPGKIREMLDGLFQNGYADGLETWYQVRDPSGMADIATKVVTAGVVVDRPEYRITAAPSKHMLDTHGYRIETPDGRALVLTGDTSYCESIVELARGAHTIVHECFMADQRNEDTKSDFLRGIHANPEDAAATAQEAGAKRLVLVHLPPAADTDEVVARCEAAFDGEVILGEDFMELEI